jgi:hypothetical protein
MYFVIAVSLLVTSAVALSSEYFNLKINSTNPALDGKYVTPATAAFANESQPEILYVGGDAPPYPFANENGLFYYYYLNTEIWSLYYEPDVNDTAVNMDQVLNVMKNDTYISPFNLLNATIDGGDIFEFKNRDDGWFACNVTSTPEVSMQGVVYVTEAYTPHDSCEIIGIYAENIN